MIFRKVTIKMNLMNQLRQKKGIYIYQFGSSMVISDQGALRALLLPFLSLGPSGDSYDLYLPLFTVHLLPISALLRLPTHVPPRWLAPSLKLPDRIDWSRQLMELMCNNLVWIVYDCTCFYWWLSVGILLLTQIVLAAAFRCVAQSN